MTPVEHSSINGVGENGVARRIEGNVKVVNVIYVEPMAHGWSVRQDETDNPQVFASGAKAEDAALRLAERLANAGRTSEVRVYLRDGVLGGRFTCPAQADADL